MKYILFLVCALQIFNVNCQNIQGKDPFIFVYQGKDTVLNRTRIQIWAKTNNFPQYLKWKNTKFSIRPSNIHGVGLFTDSLSQFSSGQDVGLAFVNVANTGIFMNDFYETNIGMFVNDSPTPNVQIINTSAGLMMRAIANIPPNTEIIASYQDIFDLFPNDTSVKFLIKYK